MSRRGADDISGSPVLQRRLLQHGGPASRSSARRDELIAKLDAEGYSHAQIAKHVGLTALALAW